MWATDISAAAVAVARANTRRLGLSGRVRCAVADLLPPSPRRFDVVVANILADPLVLLAPVLAARVGSRGRIALSGILAGQAGDVIAAYERWFTLAVWRSLDGWVLLAGARRDVARSGFPGGSADGALQGKPD